MRGYRIIRLFSHFAWLKVEDRPFLFSEKKGLVLFANRSETRVISGHMKENGDIPRVVQIRLVDRVIIVTIRHTALLVKFGGLKRQERTRQEKHVTSLNAKGGKQ